MIALFFDKIYTPYYFSSLIFYFLVLVISVFFLYLYEYKSESFPKFKIVWLIGACFLPCIIYGVRYDVGTDYFSYVRIYEEIKSYDNFFLLLKNLKLGNDFLYVLINYLISKIFDDSAVLFLFIGIFNIVLILKGLLYFKKDISVTLGFTIFYLTLFPYTTNAVRSCMACSIIFFAIRYLFEENNFKYLLCIFIAALFHKTALLGVVFLFLKNYTPVKNRIRNIMLYLVILLTPLTVKFAIDSTQYLPILNIYYYRYAYRIKTEASISGFGILWLLPIVFLVLIFSNKLKKYNHSNEVLINIFLLKIPLLFSGYYMVWCYRLRLFSEIAEFLLIPMIIRLQKKKINKITFGILVITYYIVYFVYKFFLTGTNDIFPYQTIGDSIC